MIADAAGGNSTRPARNHRHAYTAFVQIALDASQRAGALEEFRIAAALLMRSVVADKHDQRVSLDPARPQEIGEPADIAVHARNHRGECGVWCRLRAVPERGQLGTGAGWPRIRLLVLERRFRK